MAVEVVPALFNRWLRSVDCRLGTSVHRLQTFWSAAHALESLTVTGAPGTTFLNGQPGPITA